MLQGCAAISALLPTFTGCVSKDDVPKMPAIADNAALAKMDDHALVLTIASERLELIYYAKQAVPLLQECSR